MAHLTDMTAVCIREGLASKEFSAREVAQAHLDHMDAAEPKVHAFLERTDALALDAADPEPCAFAQYPVAGYRKVRVVVR